MKFIPDALGRKIGSSELLASEKAPKVLFVGGVVGMVGSTVLACRATLKLSDILDQIEHDKAAFEDAHAEVNSPDYQGDRYYPDKEYRADIARISVKGVGKIVGLYAPAVAVGGISIFALTKSHNILQDRNMALAAAYAAVDGAYTRYRERVVDRYGEDVDRELLYETEQVDIVDEETGEVISTVQITDAPGSRYARWYDKESASTWTPDPHVRMLALRNCQNYCNDWLRSHGHMFLNEVFTELGMSHTTAGAIVGWRWDKESGDDFIDFGIWKDGEEVIQELFNGREGAVLLDFNVDGVIYDKIEEDIS